MNLLWTLIIGLIAGALAKFLMPGKDPGGIIVTMLLGVAGAFVANWLGGRLGWYGPNHNAGIIGSTIGAILILVVYHFVRSAMAKKSA
jgi:uncharacterized membrane protein YeaQ/YmgE (transglycosylase-associated protein family)